MQLCQAENRPLSSSSTATHAGLEMDDELQRIAALPQKDKVSYFTLRSYNARSSARGIASPTTRQSGLQPDAPRTLVQSQAYLALLEQTLVSSSDLPRDLARWLSVVVGADFPQIVARQVLEGYVSKLPSIEDREARKAVLKRSIELLQPRVTSFEEEVRQLSDYQIRSARFRCSASGAS